MNCFSCESIFFLSLNESWTDHYAHMYEYIVECSCGSVSETKNKEEEEEGEEATAIEVNEKDGSTAACISIAVFMREDTFKRKTEKQLYPYTHVASMPENTSIVLFFILSLSFGPSLSPYPTSLSAMLYKSRALYFDANVKSCEHF